MNHKTFSYLVMLIALIIGILSLINQNTFAIAAITSRFFEMMIPVLGVGALCKYLMCCKSSN